MPVFVDPKSGERFENVPDDAVEQAQATYGLVPEATYAKQQAEEQKPLLQKAGESVQAYSNALIRPVEALADRFGISGHQSEVNRRVAGTWSPSDEAARDIAEAHPVSSALGSATAEAPLMGLGGIPGAVVRVGAGAVLGASENAFHQGREYGDFTPEELAKMAAIGGGLEAALPGVRALRGLVQGAREGGRAVATEAAALAGEVARRAPGAVGRAGQGAVERAVEGAISSATTGVGATLGGSFGAMAGAAAGRALNKAVGKPLAQRIWAVASRASAGAGPEVASPGLLAAAALGEREGAEAIAGAVGTSLAAKRIVAASAEAGQAVTGHTIANETADWLYKHSNLTSGETVAAAVSEAVEKGAARAEVAAANEAAAEGATSAAQEALESLADQTPQERVRAIQASGVRLGGDARAQRDALARNIDDLVQGMAKASPDAADAGRAFAELAHQQLATARTAAERYAIGVKLVETLADQTARAGNSPMAKVLGAYTEKMWETVATPELWMSSQQLANLGKRAARAPKIIPAIRQGEEIAESVARGEQRAANDVATSAPVDAEAVAVGTGFSPAFSKSGRAAEAWKGSERQAASIDARIQAYGSKPEFLDLLHEKAAEARRTPFAPGHERELWELQKDVLDENEALFPRISSGGGGEPTAIRGSNPAEDTAVSRLRSRARQRGSVSLGGELSAAESSPVNLSGMTLEDLHALPLDGANDLARVQKLKDADEFARTGRVTSNDGRQGITLSLDSKYKELHLQDGRHRLAAAQEMGRDDVWGRIVDAETGKEIYQGPIPLKGERDLGTGMSTFEIRKRIKERAAQGGSVSLAGAESRQGGSLSLGGIAASPIGIGTAATGGIAAANVLARARRRADESVGIRDLEGLAPEQRAAALRSGADRFRGQAVARVHDALEAGGEALDKARGELRERVADMTAEPSDAQRQFAASQLMGLANAESALREMGHGDDARALEPVLDALTELEVAHEQRMPISHDASELMRQLTGAEDALRRHVAELPPEAAQSLTDLAEGLGRDDLWGDAAGAWRDLGAARAAEVGADPGEEESVQGYLESARALVDAAERWGVDTESLRDKLGELDAALEASATLQRELGAVEAEARPRGGALESAAAETGAASDDILAGLEPGVVAMHEAGSRVAAYDDTLRAIERGSMALANRAARAAAGGGLSTAEVDPDRSTAEFAAGYSDELAAFEARRDTLERIAQDPQLLADAMAESYGHMADTHPEAFSELVGVATRAVDVLTEAMPPSVAQSIQSPRGLPPSVDDVRAFARVYVSVTEPSSYLRDLGAGQAWPEQSQAFAKVYPGQWSKLAETAVQTAKERGMALTPQEASYLDLTFGIGNVIGGMWSDSGSQAIIGAVQAAKEKRQQAKASAGGRPATPPTSATAALGAGPSSLPVS